MADICHIYIFFKQTESRCLKRIKTLDLQQIIRRLVGRFLPTKTLPAGVENGDFSKWSESTKP